jgi:hypothetical protein
MARLKENLCAVVLEASFPGGQRIRCFESNYNVDSNPMAVEIL